MAVSICCITYHWRRLCRRDRTQFYPDDCVAAVVWVVLDNRISHRRTSTFGLAGGGGGGEGRVVTLLPEPYCPNKLHNARKCKLYICTRIAVKTKTFPILTSNETIIISIFGTSKGNENCF